MSDQIVEPQGSLRIETERHGVKAGVTLYFVFDGGWAAQYDDALESEDAAHAHFVSEVFRALEDKKDAAREDVQA